MTNEELAQQEWDSVSHIANRASRAAQAYSALNEKSHEQASMFYDDIAPIINKQLRSEPMTETLELDDFFPHIMQGQTFNERIRQIENYQTDAWVQNMEIAA